VSNRNLERKMTLADRGDCTNCERNCGGFISPAAQCFTHHTLCAYCGHPYGQHRAFSESALDNVDAELVQQLEEMKVTIANLLKSNERKVFCRLWTGDSKVHRLSANSYSEFDDAVRKRYGFQKEEYLSYFIIQDEAQTREYIYNNTDLKNFFQLGTQPTIYVWYRGKLPSSSFSLPSHIQIKTSSTTVSFSDESSSEDEFSEESSEDPYDQNTFDA